MKQNMGQDENGYSPPTYGPLDVVKAPRKRGVSWGGLWQRRDPTVGRVHSLSGLQPDPCNQLVNVRLGPEAYIPPPKSLDFE